ncbi:glucan endo-1,3-beta-glucosidase 13-like isoform X2 [Macadamia integrifolia]|uniref:glucan endo-1,3-beta-glucosidase 13-like isoform X2 n=1 Tax=Macadamia integrifolia TaxID=60698 RepID=UPI001C4F161C|nr:glucan endo-1,3-beta-glucosidase 13-like isoform X2 [Macadamia integrifolia]
MLPYIFISLALVQATQSVSTIEGEGKGEGEVLEKVESTIPITANSPPEGNTTFIDGTTWCVARPGVSQADLQNALDWACGLGMADCHPIQSGGSCFEPDTLLSHASYAFNNYYQKNGNSDIACNFGGTATVVTRDPSYGSCAYATAGSEVSSSAPLLFRPSLRWWELFQILLLLYMRR